MSAPIGVVVIGASVGGLTVLHQILGGLPSQFGWPIAIVQHRAAESFSQFAETLQRRCRLPVLEPDDKTPLDGGRVYVAPPDYHMLIDIADALPIVSLSTEGRVNWARPSIDVLFDSAAAVFRGATIAVLLTGASHDGAAGARSVRQHGGYVIVQDPTTAECPVMPTAAITLGIVDQVAVPAKIAELLERKTLSRAA